MTPSMYATLSTETLTQLNQQGVAYIELMHKSYPTSNAKDKARHADFIEALQEQYMEIAGELIARGQHVHMA